MDPLEKMREVCSFIMENTRQFELEEIREDLIHLRSKETDYSQYKEEDQQEAERLKKLLEGEFENVETTIGTCNEWVYIHINPNA